MNPKSDNRNICVVVHSRANYGRIKSVLQAIHDHPDLNLLLLVGGSAVLSRFGNVSEQIEKDGFKITARVPFIVEGETPTTMAKSTGLAIIELATLFENLKPDIVLTVADRFETIATAIAASYMNIPVAHTQGGEVTGSIDESVRHAITRLSHIHFPATKRSAEYLEKMGESEESVFFVGCPSIDIVAQCDRSMPTDFFKKYNGVGVEPDPAKPYIVVLQHPVTTEFGSGLDQINATLKATADIDVHKIWLWPNIDAGSDDVARGIRIFRETHTAKQFSFYKNFAVEDYTKLISNCACLVGNSSSAIREGAFLSIPAVNIGSRQNYRECSDNVVTVPHDAGQIKQAIGERMAHPPFSSSDMFGTGDAGVKIADVLAKADLNVKKVLAYAKEDVHGGLYRSATLLSDGG